MNTLLDNGLRVFACGTAAAAITLAMSLSFVQSTAVVHNERYTPVSLTAELSGHRAHTWFGQSQPAVLVD
jgi:hypothetical protein